MWKIVVILFEKLKKSLTLINVGFFTNHILTFMLLQRANCIWLRQGRLCLNLKYADVLQGWTLKLHVVLHLSKKWVGTFLVYLYNKEIFIENISWGIIALRVGWVFSLGPFIKDVINQVGRGVAKRWFLLFCL